MKMSITATNQNHGNRGRPGGSEEAIDDGGGLSGGVSSKINRWERKTRSLSPARQGGRAADDADMVEIQAQMAVLADATNVVRLSNDHPCCLDTAAGCVGKAPVLANNGGSHG